MAKLAKLLAEIRSLAEVRPLQLGWGQLYTALTTALTTALSDNLSITQVVYKPLPIVSGMWLSHTSRTRLPHTYRY